MTAEPVHAHGTRPYPAPQACLLPSSTISLPSSNRHDHIMALEEALEILEVLVPIAKAVPILGVPVEGSLEALSKILKFAQVRHLFADLISLDFSLSTQMVKSNKTQTTELAVQAARWLNTVISALDEPKLKANHAELAGLRPNMEEVLKCVVSQLYVHMT
jgi:hypothetical protein